MNTEKPSDVINKGKVIIEKFSDKSNFVAVEVISGAMFVDEDKVRLLKHVHEVFPHGKWYIGRLDGAPLIKAFSAKKL